MIYLKNEGGNEKLEPEREQRVKNRKISGHTLREEILTGRKFGEFGGLDKNPPN